MTRIVYEKCDGYHSLTIDGHSMYSDYGHDIVCAGISSIVYALLCWLQNHEDEIDYTEEVCDGHFEVSCYDDEATQTAMEMAVMGLAQIAYKYPQYVSISYDQE